LLTGDYLYDEDLSSSVDGVFQPGLKDLANHYQHIQFQHENMQRIKHLKETVEETLKSSVPKGPVELQAVAALMQSPQNVEPSYKRPTMMLNTITQCLDLQGVLYTILNELSENLLNQLLFLSKHSIQEINQASSTQILASLLDEREQNVSVRSVWRISARYQFVPYMKEPEDFVCFDVHTLPSDPGRAHKLMNAGLGNMRITEEFLLCLMCCSGLQALKTPMERLLIITHWLALHWPGEDRQLFAMDERDSSMAVRLAFIMNSFLRSVKEASITMHILETYDYWTEFCSLLTDVVAYIAISARQGISRQHLQESLVLLESMCTDAVRELIMTLHALTPSSHSSSLSK